MPIQDVYKFDEKRILVGRVESGIVSEGQEVLFLPSRKKTKIKSVEFFGEDIKEASSGKSIGITLEDPLFIERGEILCSVDNVPNITNEIYANVFWMSPKNLDINEELLFRCATQEIPCKIQKINKRIDSSTLEIKERDASKIEDTEVGDVIIKTEEPVVIENFNDIEELGRFVLVTGYDVSAGGIISKV